MEQPLPNSTITSYPSSVTSAVFSEATWQRPWAAVYNNSATADLYLALASEASNLAFTCKLAPQGYYEIPNKYTGPISGVWSAVDGAALVTELKY